MLTGSLKSIGRTGVFAVLALLLGGLGVIAARMNQPAPPPAAPPKLFDVPVASTDLQAGRTIAKSDFFIQKMTLEQKKAAGFVDSHFSAGKDLIDRIIMQPLKKGKYFTLDSLYPEGTGPSISEKLRPGMRAVVISVEPASVTNLTTPDSYVDVLFHPSGLTSGDSPGARKLVGGRILERLEVMAVDLNWYSQSLAASKPDPGRSARVTLAVTVEQAEMLKSLESVGRFSLIAVPASAPPATESIPNPERMKQILGNIDAPPPPFRSPQIEVVRAGVISKVMLDSTIGPSTASADDFEFSRPMPNPRPATGVPPAPATITTPVFPVPTSSRRPIRRPSQSPESDRTPVAELLHPDNSRTGPSHSFAGNSASGQLKSQNLAALTSSRLLSRPNMPSPAAQRAESQTIPSGRGYMPQRNGAPGRNLQSTHTVVLVARPVHVQESVVLAETSKGSWPHQAGRRASLSFHGIRRR